MAGAANPAMRIYALVATLAGALAVILGAFGAHALRGHIDDAGLQVWHTAVEYQFWHAVTLMAISLSPLPASRWLRASAIAFVLGSVLFCGSLYALALGAPRAIGVVTPFGGVALIGGWIMAGAAIWRRSA